jgi:hypothetical protein
MTESIDLKLFASLAKFAPPCPQRFPVSPGVTVGELARDLGIPEEEIKLVFVDGVLRDTCASLRGGERVGIFPPVGGG